MKKLFILSVVAGFTLPMLAQAEDITATVRSVSKNKSKVLISAKRINRLNKGDLLEYGENCSLEVTKRTSKKAVLTTELCEDTGSFVKGNKIVLTLEGDSPTTSAQVGSSADGAIPTSNRTRRQVYKPAPVDSSMVAKGFRIGFVKSMFDIKGKVTIRDFDGDSYSESFKDDLEQEFGFSFGYAAIPLNSAGFMAGLTYSTIEDDVTSIRLEGNGTYGLNQTAYIFGGINIHEFGGDAADFDSGMGFQIGTGLQFTREVGLNIALVTTNNEASDAFAKAEIETTGLELSIHGTF